MAKPSQRRIGSSRRSAASLKPFKPPWVSPKCSGKTQRVSRVKQLLWMRLQKA
jgi:hypothetical protein